MKTPGLENNPSTLEDLYTCFKKYEPSDLECCSCCHNPEFVDDLKSTPLRSLGSQALHDYFSSALYTCSGTSAFKYFLPRLFELFPEDLWQFQTKFEYIHWEEWDAEEINVIKKHVLSLWHSGKWPYSYPDFFSFFSFDEIYGFWIEDVKLFRESLQYIADFEFKNLSEKEKIYSLIEERFFDEVDNDSVFAEELSIAASYVLCLPPWD